MIASGEASLHDSKLSATDVADVEIAALGDHRGNAAVETLQHVRADENTEAERPHDRSVQEVLYGTSRTFAGDRPLTPAAFAHGEKNVVRAFSRHARCLSVSL